MKLLPEEYQAIHSLLDQHGYVNDHLLVKKKGWLHIDINGNVFSFHRKDSTEIIEGKFVSHQYYLIRVCEIEKRVAEFKDVKKELEIWLVGK